MAFAPLVVTDETDSQAFSSETIERPESELSHLDSFQYVHWCGLPHRSVHMEIVNSLGQYFVWERRDGRLEIPGGHVDWLRSENRPETYEEAARREIVEELGLDKMFGDATKALNRLLGLLVPVERVVNQIPSSHVNNNEWVTVYRLHWPEDWHDPCQSLQFLAEQKRDSHVEGKAVSARWTALDEIKQKSHASPMGINAALRLFLLRRGIMVRVLLSVYVEKYPRYREKICPNAQ